MFHFYGASDDAVSLLARLVWGERTGVPSLARTLVVVPSGRVGRRLRHLWLSMARERGAPGLVLPKVVGLKQFAEMMPLPMRLRPVSNEERIIRLAEMLHSVPLRRLIPTGSDVSALRLASFLLSGLDDLARYSPGFDGIVGNLDQLQDGDEPLPATIRQLLSDAVGRSLELQTRFVESLRSQGLEDPVLGDESLLLQVSQAPELGSWLACYERVWVGLFQDATRGELALLSSLARRPNVELLLMRTHAALAKAMQASGRTSVPGVERHPFYPAWRLASATSALEHEDSVEPPSAIGAAFPLPGRGHLVTGEAPDLTPDLARNRVVEFEDGFHEAMGIALHVVETLEAGQTIMVTYPGAQGARLLESLLSAWGVDFDSTYGRPLSHAPLLGLLRQVDELIQLQFPYQVVAGLFSNPLCRLGMEAPLRELAWQLEREIVPDQRITSGLDRLAEASSAREVRLKAAATGDAAVKADYGLLRTALKRLGQAVGPLVEAMSAPRSVPEHAKAALLALDSLLGNSLQASELVQGDLVVFNRLGGFTQTTAGEEMSVEWGEFRDLFYASLAGERIHEPRNREMAVLITDPGQARFFHRDVHWHAGLVDGEVPKAEQSNPLLPNDARQVLGMPGPSYWESLSAMDFVQAWSSSVSSFFSYPRYSAGTPLIRSRFIERIAGLAASQRINQEQWLEVRPYATALPRRSTQDFLSLRLDDYPEPVVQNVTPAIMEIWATDLESYLRCPYQFFCKRELGLQPPEEIKEVLTAQELGTLVHDGLRAFYDSDRKGIEALPGPFVGDLTLATAGQAEELLAQIFDASLGAQRPTDLASLDMQRQLQGSVLPIIHAEVARWDEGFRPWRFEKQVRLRPAATPSLLFKARFDRIDRMVDDPHKVAVLDYKTGNPPPNSELAAGLRPQLFVTALALEQEPEGFLTIEQIAYYRVPVLSGSDRFGTPKQLLKDGSRSAPARKMLLWLEQYRDLLGRVALDLTDVTGTRYPAVPGPYCQWCSYASICRKEEVNR